MALFRRLYEKLAFVACSDEVRVGDQMLYLPLHPGDVMHHVGFVVEPPSPTGQLEIAFERLVVADNPKLSIPLRGEERGKPYARLRSDLRHYPSCPAR